MARTTEPLFRRHDMIASGALITRCRKKGSTMCQVPETTGYLSVLMAFNVKESTRGLFTLENQKISKTTPHMLMFQVDPKFYEATNSTGLKCLNSLTCSAWLLPAHAEKLTFVACRNSDRRSWPVQMPGAVLL